MAVCLYHKDLDGWASGAIIKYRHPQMKMYPIDYGEEVPVDWILDAKNPVLFMVDFCPSDFDLVERLVESCNIFVWIDHHVSSIKEAYSRGLFDKFHSGCTAYLDEHHERYAACELTYMWALSKNQTYEEVPYYIKLLGMYDTWRFDDANVLPFQYAMRAWIDNPKDNISQWKKLIQNTPKDQEVLGGLIEKGKFVQKYEQRKQADLASQTAFEVDFQGYRAIAANVAFTNSKFFDAVWQDNRHDLMIAFMWTGSQWRISFYSPKIDVSKIAEQFQGGGHQNASGCNLKELPEELKEAVCNPKS